MTGRVVDREGVQAPLLPWVRPARPGRPLNRTAATGHTALASRTSALPPGRVGPVNEYANDAAGDEPIEGGAGTRTEAGIESDAGTRDQRQDPVSVEASAGQREIPEPPATGESAVDDALARLSQISEAPTADHVEIYDDVHRRLTDALADVDED